MSYKQWGIALVFVLSIGCLQVWQRTSVVMRGYAVGEQVSAIHDRSTEVAWLEGAVIEMRSPARLAAFAREREWKLVAWERLRPVQEEAPLYRLAAIAPAYSFE